MNELLIVDTDCKMYRLKDRNLNIFSISCLNLGFLSFVSTFALLYNSVMCMNSVDHFVRVK